MSGKKNAELPLCTAEYIRFIQEQRSTSTFQACHAPVKGIPRRVLDAIKVEAGQRERMPRILLDPNSIQTVDLSIGRFQSDILRLHQLLTKRSEDFAKLIQLIHRPKEFIRQSKRIGLTEKEFASTGGGFIEILVLLAAAIGLTGCSDNTAAAPQPKQCSVSVVCKLSPVAGGATVAQDYSVDLSFTPTSTLHVVDNNYVYGFITYDKAGAAATATSLPSSRVSIVRGVAPAPTVVTVTLPYDVYPPGTVLFVRYGYTCPTCGANSEATTTVAMP